MHFGQDFKWSKNLLLTNICITEMLYLSYDRYRPNDAPDDISFIRYIFFFRFQLTSAHVVIYERAPWRHTLFLYRMGKRFTVQRLAHCRVKERALSIYYASMKCGSVDENLSEAMLMESQWKRVVQSWILTKRVCVHVCVEN